MKRCLTLLVIGKMQIEISIRELHTPARMAKMRKTDITKYWRRCEVFETHTLGMFNESLSHNAE